MSYENHAWRHRPKAQGGTDPIPGLEAGEDTSYGTMYELMGPGSLDAFSTDWAGFDTAFTIQDVTKYGNWKLENKTPFTGGAYADGASWYRAVRLGPYGSVWRFNLVADTGTDCGRLKFSLASDPENDIGGATPTIPDGYLSLDPENDLTFVDLKVDPNVGPVYHDNIDLYAVSPAVSYVNSIAEFRILGQPGDALTSASVTSDGYANTNVLDGGPGMYWVKMTVDGKNASSSAYRCSIRGFWIVRSTVTQGYNA